jgi:putative protein kinase ArgK-like GTPase of G3E family
VPTTATENKGLDRLSEAIDSFYAFQKSTENLERKRAIARWRLLELLQEKLLENILRKNGTSEKLDKLALDIAEKKNNPYAAVEEIINSQ